MKLPEAVERNIQLLRKLIQINKKRNYPKMTPQAERMFGALASNWMNHEPIRVKEAVLIDTSQGESSNFKTIKELTKSGWIELVVDEKDNRVKYIQPTELALQYLQEYGDALDKSCQPNQSSTT